MKKITCIDKCPCDAISDTSGTRIPMDINQLEMMLTFRKIGI